MFSIQQNRTEQADTEAYFEYQRPVSANLLSPTFVLRRANREPGKDGTEAGQTGKDGERTDQD
jgi:hypothetical protein